MRGTDQEFLRAIRAKAQDLGFVLVSSINYSKPQSHGKYLEWIRQGYYGGMTYLSAENSLKIRGDPAILLKDCQSIISLGLLYCLPSQLPKIKPNEGRIAAFAQGLDYHDVTIELAERLSGWLKTAYGSRMSTLTAVDSKPILERDAAAMGGIGWIGKNSCLISPKYGSCFFLAEILTDREIRLPQYKNNTDHCGDCQLCIEACPTKCIMPDRTIDASRCNSYLTIEHKGSIPVPSRRALGEWVFGCDICQMVCPWNNGKMDRKILPQFLPQRKPVFPDLSRELAISTEEFMRKFDHTSIMRIGRTRHLRNIAIAIGNTRPVNALSALTLCMKSEKDELIRAHAAWALGNLRSLAAKDALRSCLKTESSVLVKEEIMKALI